MQGIEPVQQPIAIRPRAAAHLLSISPRFLWQLTKDGGIPHIKVGGGKRSTVLYAMDDLKKWLSGESKD